MSTQLQFRKQQRAKKRKKKMRRTIFFSVLSLIIIIILISCVKGFLSKNGKNYTMDSDFIYNGYIYPQPPEKNVDILVDAKKFDNIKTAYLTFDDGPNNSITPAVLDILRRYNIKATFFMVGTLIEKNPDMARRVYDEGHCIANHSYNHDYSELYANTTDFMSQINKTQELIASVTNKNNYPKIFRFPGGGYNAGSYGALKQDCKVTLQEAGYRFCDWNSLTGDAELKSPTAEGIFKRLASSSKDKEDLVVLMHDAVAKKITAETLGGVIDYLISQGYVFDTLANI